MRATTRSVARARSYSARTSSSGSAAESTICAPGRACASTSAWTRLDAHTTTSAAAMARRRPQREQIGGAGPGAHEADLAREGAQVIVGRPGAVAARHEQGGRYGPAQ